MLERNMCLAIPIRRVTASELRARKGRRGVVYTGADPLDGQLLRIGRSLVCMRIGAQQAEFVELDLDAILGGMGEYAEMTSDAEDEEEEDEEDGWFPPEGEVYEIPLALRQMFGG